MNLMNRRTSLAAITAAGLSLWTNRQVTKAQYTEQQVRNDLQVTSTGNVNVDQAASGNQSVEVLVDGQWVHEDGIYRDGATQVVVNDGQITSTGNVNVRQSASGDQRVTTVVRHSSTDWYDGMPADKCEPGKVIANPDTGELYYQARDCCYWKACASPCQKKAGCEGDYCGQHEGQGK